MGTRWRRSIAHVARDATLPAVVSHSSAADDQNFSDHRFACANSRL
jgi:hypothetical protein